MDDALLVRVLIEPMRANPARAWGLLREGDFILLHTSSAEVWAECGTHIERPITITAHEADTVEYGLEPPDHVLVALAKFRLTGSIDAPAHLFE